MGKSIDLINFQSIALQPISTPLPPLPLWQNGLTPLDLACQQGHVEMVQLLLENSADTNHRASKGVTSMHLTAQEDKVLVAPILLQHGANINTQTKVRGLIIILIIIIIIIIINNSSSIVIIIANVIIKIAIILSF